MEKYEDNGLGMNSMEQRSKILQDHVIIRMTENVT